MTLKGTFLMQMLMEKKAQHFASAFFPTRIFKSPQNRVNWILITAMVNILMVTITFDCLISTVEIQPHAALILEARTQWCQF